MFNTSPLDQLHGKGHAPGADDAKDSKGDITDADFDKMLENVEEQTHAKEKQKSDQFRRIAVTIYRVTTFQQPLKA